MAKDIEIPFEKDRKGHYRFFEILPGALSYGLLILIVILSWVTFTLPGFSNPMPVSVPFILAYLLIYFVRSVGYSLRAIGGYRTMRHHMSLDWSALLDDLEAGEQTDHKTKRPSWHVRALSHLEARPGRFLPSEVTHAVIIATYKESREVLEPTIQAVLNSNYDSKRMILIFAYEGRAGQETEDRVKALMDEYGHHFADAMMFKHPSNLPNEIIGKGGNITFAGRQFKKYVEKKGIDPAKILVTTLDADNRPDKRYFASLTYTFCVVPNPLRASYQPLAMFTNNIWDAPTMMRVLATGNTLFYIVGSRRPHLARNFSAHAQPMQSLIDMDFWSTRSVVEDGHHFWRSYFCYDGDYRVYPLSIPIYQDAVLADGYWRTLKAQFIQLRRWTYGASDIAYIAHQGFYQKTKAPKLDVLGKLLRSLEGHVTWATGPLIIYFASRIPVLFHPQSYAANTLPIVVSRVQQLGIGGLLVSLYVCLVTLPPRPLRYKRHRSLLMLTQWITLPITTVVYGCLAAFNSQTRLMFKWYLTKFDVTEKAVIVESDGQYRTVTKV
jgi:hypothetical protein